MSSRELLVLIEEFPETSLFKAARDRTVLVDGFGPVVDWTVGQYAEARGINELALLRCDLAASNGAEMPPPELMVSPVQRAEELVESGEIEDLLDDSPRDERHVLDQVEEDMFGWTEG